MEQFHTFPRSPFLDNFRVADQPGVMVAMAVPSGFAADPIVDLRVAYITTAFAV